MAISRRSSHGLKWSLVRRSKQTPKSGCGCLRELTLVVLGLVKKGKAVLGEEGGGGGTPYDDLYGEAPPERDTFSRLQVY